MKNGALNGTSASLGGRYPVGSSAQNVSASSKTSSTDNTGALAGRSRGGDAVRVEISSAARGYSAFSQSPNEKPAITSSSSEISRYRFTA
ncbi:MAG TPA: hypothetical protein PKA63_02640 [Oligoflexia bacterium]|nr:hypothetical protein [Oligoflexia bacterium]HMP47550.1 hypothetical protein [Oligoflexia bacterium]